MSKRDRGAEGADVDASGEITDAGAVAGRESAMRLFAVALSRSSDDLLQALTSVHDNLTPLRYSADAVILDIEGTITPLPFVATTLFPFARARMAEYIEKHFEDEAVQKLIPTIAEDAAANAADGAPKFDAASAKASEVSAALLWSMSKDRKFTPLKSLQGLIWEAGYASGELRGELFDDVIPRLREWKEAGVKVYIYSSGSIYAQKLLLKHSVEGDVLDIFSGHFDTTTGLKGDASSYTAIAKAVGCSEAPSRCVFFTDIHTEADAAVAAGMKAVMTVRPQNKPLELGTDGGPLGRHPAVLSLKEVEVVKDEIANAPAAKR